MTGSPSLLEAQRALHRAIVDQEGGDLEQLLASDAWAIAGAVSVYRNTIFSTLTRALRLSYPAVYKLVGSQFFEGAVETYLRKHWPESACLDDFGADFSVFLASFAPAGELFYLADVARLEWAVHQALQAPDVPALRLERLLQLDDARRGAVRFVANPSLRLLAVGTSAEAIWRAVLEHDESALSGMQIARAPRWLIVQRTPDGAAEVVRAEEGEWQLLQLLASGVALQNALDCACRAWPQPALEEVLARHLAAGRFTDFAA